MVYATTSNQPISGETAMFKALYVILASFAISHAAMAADSACESKAADKKLAGAAKTSFIKKCEKDSNLLSAQDDCTAKAAEKKLAGAAKSSFTKKCVSDATKK
jgi:hypothetical protein